MDNNNKKNNTFENRFTGNVNPVTSSFNPSGAVKELGGDLKDLYRNVGDVVVNNYNKAADVNENEDFSKGTKILSTAAQVVKTPFDIAGETLMTTPKLFTSGKTEGLVGEGINQVIETGIDKYTNLKKKSKTLREVESGVKFIGENLTPEQKVIFGSTAILGEVALDVFTGGAAAKFAKEAAGEVGEVALRKSIDNYVGDTLSDSTKNKLAKEFVEIKNPQAIKRRLAEEKAIKKAGDVTRAKKIAESDDIESLLKRTDDDIDNLDVYDDFDLEQSFIGQSELNSSPTGRSRLFIEDAIQTFKNDITDINVDAKSKADDIMERFGKNLSEKDRILLRKRLSLEQSYSDAGKALRKLPELDSMTDAQKGIYQKNVEIQTKAQSDLSKLSLDGVYETKNKQAVRLLEITKNKQVKARARGVRSSLNAQIKAARAEGDVVKIKEALDKIKVVDDAAIKANKNLEKFNAKIEFNKIGKKDVNISKLHNVGQSAILEKDKVKAVFEKELTNLSEELKDVDFKTFVDERQGFGDEGITDEAQKRVNQLFDELNKLSFELGITDELQKTGDYIPRELKRRDGKLLTDADKDRIAGYGVASDLSLKDLRRSKTFEGDTKYKSFEEYKEALKGTPYEPVEDLQFLYVNKANKMIRDILSAKRFDQIQDIADAGLRPDEVVRLYNPAQLKTSISIAKEQGQELITQLKGALRGKAKTDTDYKKISNALENIQNSGLYSTNNLDDLILDLDIDGLSSASKKLVTDIDTVKDFFKGQELEAILKTRKNITDSVGETVSEILLKSADLRDKGLKPLISQEVRNSKGFNKLIGVYGDDVLYRGLKEQHTKLNRDGFVGNVKSIGDAIKIKQVVGDLFSQILSLNLSAAAGKGFTGSVKGLAKGITHSMFEITNVLGSKKAYKKLTGRDLNLFDNREFGDGGGYILSKSDGIQDVKTYQNTIVEFEDSLNKVEKLFESAKKTKDNIVNKELLVGDVNVNQTKILDNVYGKFNKGLQSLEKLQYEAIMDPIKSDAWNKYTRKFIDQGMGAEDAKVYAGQVVDRLTLVTNFESAMAKYPRVFQKSVQQGLGAAIFSPNMTVSTANMLIAPFKDILGGKVPKKVAARLAVGNLLKVQMYAQALSYALNGESTFQNPDKSRIFSVRIPGLEDEKGNAGYIDLDFITPRVYSMFNMMGRTMKNKRSSAIGLGNALLSEDIYNEGRANMIWNTVAPIPITAREMFSKYSGMNNYEDDYGVVTDAKTQLILAAGEMLGSPTRFSSGTPDRASLSGYIKEVKDLLMKGENPLSINEYEYFRAMLTNGKAPTISDAMLSKYGLDEGSESEVAYNMSQLSDEEFKKILELNPKKKEDYTKWQIAMKSPGLMSKKQLEAVYKASGILKEDEKLYSSTYTAYERKYEHKLKLERERAFVDSVEGKPNAYEQIKEFRKTNFTPDEKKKDDLENIIYGLYTSNKLTEGDAKEYLKEVKSGKFKVSNLKKLLEDINEQ